MATFIGTYGGKDYFEVVCRDGVTRVFGGSRNSGEWWIDSEFFFTLDEWTDHTTPTYIDDDDELEDFGWVDEQQTPTKKKRKKKIRTSTFEELQNWKPKTKLGKLFKNIQTKENQKEALVKIINSKTYLSKAEKIKELNFNGIYLKKGKRLLTKLINWFIR